MSDWENGLPDGQYRFAPEGLEQHKARLKGAADALSAATRSGEDIALDKDAAHAVLAKAEEIREKLRQQRDQASRLQQMTPPSQDVASEAYNKFATTGGASDFVDAVTGSSRAFDAGKIEIGNQFDYITKFIVNLRKALGVTANEDENAATAVENSGTSSTDNGGYF